MIKVENLHKSFKGTEVLKGINLEISQSEVVAILGSSGTGKSTLLRCLNYLVEPTKGKIMIGDVKVDVEKATKRYNQFKKTYIYGVSKL